MQGRHEPTPARADRDPHRRPGAPTAAYRRSEHRQDTPSGWSQDRWPADQAPGHGAGPAPYPWPADSAVDGGPAGGSPESTRDGRRRLPGVLAVACLVAAVLAAFGIGAALLAPHSPQQPAAHRVAPPAEPAAPADDVEIRVEDPVAPTPSGEPSASPTAKPTRAAVQPAPTPKVKKPSPTRKAPSRSATDVREDQVTALVNAERVKAGCGQVRTNDKLRRAAALHSADQAAHNNMSHTGSDGSSPWDRARRTGYDQAIGENVAMGYRTPEQVMDGWMNSPGHRANILNCSAKAIGVGLAYARGGAPYWTQLFGSV